MKPRLALQSPFPIFDAQEPRKKPPTARSSGGGGGKKPRGCEYCTLNGKKKIFGVITGRKILIIAMCPGKTEEAEGAPLLGKASKILWREAEKYGGFVRADCDIDNVVRCFATSNTQAFTPKGYKKLSEIVVGDLVLTHKGRFRKVTHKIHNPASHETVLVVTVRMSDGRKVHVTVTQDHLFRTSEESWILATDLEIGTQLLVLAENCRWCGRVFTRRPGNTLPFCSRSCHSFYSSNKGREKLAQSMNSQYKNGSRDRTKITEAANQKTRELSAKGKLNLQNLSEEQKIRSCISKADAKQRLGQGKDFSWIGFGERELASILEENGFSYIPQFALGRYNYDFKVGKVLVEVLGPGFSNRRARKRLAVKRSLATKKGYQLLTVRYDEVAAVPNLLKNHQNLYRFLPVKVVSVAKKSWDQGSYSLTVEEDGSYVAHGFVNHNCHPTKPGYYGEPVDRDPSKEELHCCSIHTETQLAKAHPQVILLLGEVARKQYLAGRKQYPHRIFFDKERGCRVICTFHPSYLLRGAPKSAWREFRSALAEVKNTLANPTERGYVAGNHYAVVSGGERAEALIEEYRKRPLVVFDVEDGRREDGTRFIICCGICGKPGTSHVFLTSKGQTTQALAKLLSDPKVAKSAWNGVTDVEKVEKLLGISVKNYRYDAMLSEYAAYPEAKDFRLEARVEARLKRFAGWKAFTSIGETNFANLPLKEVCLRCAVDCDVNYRLLSTSLKKETKSLVRMMTDADFICHEMSERGIPFDDEYAEKLMKYYTHWETKYVERIAMVAGDPEFNPTDDNLRELFFNQLGLESSAKTKSGKKDAVGKEALEKLLDQHPVVLDALSLRYVRKAKSTYGVSFKNSAVANGGLAKSRFKQTGTETGRMSSGGSEDRVNFQNIHGDPTVQNILVSTVLWREVMQAYANRYKDWSKQFLDLPIFLKKDESQMEIRVLAMYSEDPLLVSQLSSGEDIHTQVAMEVFGWTREKAKDKIARTIAKQIHFGIIYGLQVPGIVAKLRRLKIQTSEAQIEKARSQYFIRYRRVREWIEYAHEYTHDHGRALPSLFGLSREVRVDDRTPEEGAHWANVAVNTPIQGTAAEFLELAMALLKRNPLRYPLLRHTIVNNIHDALHWIIPLRALPEADQQASKLMGTDIAEVAKEEFGIKVNVPLVVEGEAGFRLGVSPEYTSKMTPDEVLEKWCAKNIAVEKLFGRPPSEAVIERIGK